MQRELSVDMFIVRLPLEFTENYTIQSTTYEEKYSEQATDYEEKYTAKNSVYQSEFSKKFGCYSTIYPRRKRKNNAEYTSLYIPREHR